MLVKGAGVLLATVLFGTFIATFSWWWLVLQGIVTMYFWGRLVSDIADRTAARPLRRPTSELLRYPLFDLALLTCVFADLIALGWWPIVALVGLLLGSMLIYEVADVADSDTLGLRSFFYGPWYRPGVDPPASIEVTDTATPSTWRPIGLFRR